MARKSQRTSGATSRRTFVTTGLALGAGAVGAGLLASPLEAFASQERGGITEGDIAILRFLAAAEILETDLWQQYNELGGIVDSEEPGGSGSQPYINHLINLDMDMPQYIHDNADDEFSHFTFINAYLMSKGARTVNLDKFRTLRGSIATGVNTAKIGKRLTNLMELTVDTSWWKRYRSDSRNPDLGDSFTNAVPGLAGGKFPAIPRNDNDLGPEDHIQAIANTAGFHFGFIEQGGSSLYPSLAQRVTSPEVLRILLSIGPTETSHFQTWHDKAGNFRPLVDPTNGLEFKDLNQTGGETTQTNLIMPEPTVFLNRKFPKVSIIRPTETENVAHGAVKALMDDGLFIGQVPEFFKVLDELAEAADAARNENLRYASVAGCDVRGQGSRSSARFSRLWVRRGAREMRAARSGPIIFIVRETIATEVSAMWRAGKTTNPPIAWRSLLLAVGLLLLAGCQTIAIVHRSQEASPAPQIASGLSGRLIYAAQDDGTLHVYDIDHAHRLVKVIHVFACCGDVRGAAAAAPTHRFYVMYNAANLGHVAAIDLLTDAVLWDKVVHAPGVDRGDVTPDGKRLFVPTGESDPDTPYELVLDAITGAEVARIALPPRSHDTIVSLDGSWVFMETKSATAAMYVADTITNRVVATVDGYCCTGVLAPYAVNGTNTLLVNDVNGYAGFQIGDVATGRVIASIPFAEGAGGHGIAWTPDEREVWVDDGGGPYVHVFTMSGTQPHEMHLLRVGHTPHWLTFSIDGRYAYVAGRKGAGDLTDVIDARTYQRVGTLGPSEDLLEVDASGGAIARAGKQFGVGRVTSPAASQG